VAAFFKRDKVLPGERYSGNGEAVFQCGIRTLKVQPKIFDFPLTPSLSPGGGGEGRVRGLAMM
jgi:hypothetical protein